MIVFVLGEFSRMFLHQTLMGRKSVSLWDTRQNRFLASTIMCLFRAKVGQVSQQPLHSIGGFLKYRAPRL